MSAAINSRNYRRIWRVAAGMLLISLLGGMARPACAQTTTLLSSMLKAVTGDSPFSSLMQASDGSLYGTTNTGGANNNGAIYRVLLDGTITVFHSFNKAAGEGAAPYAGLIQGSDGNFYGTTTSGGANNDGTAFKITPGGVLTILHSFTGADGATPYGGLIQATDSNYYGVTRFGGAAFGGPNTGNGVAYRITTAGVFSTIHNFSGADGSGSYAELYQGTDGNLYGTTSAGGAGGLGEVFRMTTAGVVTVLRSFGQFDGTGSQAGVIQSSDGNFYGTNPAGGPVSGGTLFKISPAGAYTVVAALNSSAAGAAFNPISGILHASDGNFYGVTNKGGASGAGAIYRLSAGTFSIIHSFGGSPTDGSNGSARIIQAVDKNLYGVTQLGGGNNNGAVFKLDIGVGNGKLAITSINPTAGAVGSSVSISGSNFKFAPITGVTFNGTASSFSVPTDILITATVPAGATTGPITVSSSLSSASSTPFTVNVPLVFTSIRVNPPTPSVNEGATQQFSAVALDQNNNPIVPQPSFTWGVSGGGNISASGLFTAGTLAAGNFNVTATSGAVTGSTTVTVLFVPLLTSILVAPSSANVPLNGTKQFGATALDQIGNLLGIQPVFNWSVNGGGAINSAGLFTAGNTPGGPFTVTSTSGAISGTAAVTVVNTAPTVATAASASPNPVAGTTTSLSVLGADDGGAANLTYTWATTGAPPAPVNFSVNGTNAAKNTVATFSKAGSYTLQATITDSLGLSVTSSVNVTVNQTLTSITVAPASASISTGATQQFTATALDQTGNPMSPQPVIAWSVSGGGAISATGLFTANNFAGGSFTVTATSGAATGNASITVFFVPVLTSIAVAPASASVSLNGSQQFTATALDQNGNPMPSQPAFNWSVSGGGAISASGLFTAGNAPGGPFTVTASSGAVNGTASITVVNAAPTVATSASASPNPVMATTTTLSALGADDGGEANLTYTWTTTGAPPAPVSFSVNGTNASKSIVATFTKAGSYAFQVTITDAQGASVTSSVSVTVNQALTSITVSPTSTSVTTGATAQFTATALDQNGNPMSPQPAIAWSVSGGGAISASGLFTANNSVGGSFTVTATSGTASGTASVTVVFVPVLTSITVSPSSASTSLNGTQQFTATALDQNGNPMPVQPAFSWSVSAGGVISASGLFTAGNAPGGPFTVTASSGSVSGTASISVVNAAPTVATSASASPNPVMATATTLSALGADDGGEANLTYTWATTGTPPAPVTFSVNGTNAAKSAVANFTKVGSYTFQVTITDAQGASVTSSVDVTVNQSLTTITVSPASTSVTTGATAQFTATALDQNGNPMSPQPAIAWSVSGGGAISASGLFTANNTTGGSFTVTATSGASSGTAAVTVVFVPVLTSITVAPANASVNTGATQQFTATALDQNGNPMPNQPGFSWAVSGGGAISAGGLFTANNSAGGSFTVTATSGATSGTAAVTVVFVPVLTSITVAPASASVNTGATQQFTATALDQNGNPMPVQPVFGWSVSGGGVISVTGLFTANNTTGGAFTVTATSGTASGTASVTVVFVPVLTSITLSPATATVLLNGTQQFTATALDQNGNPMPNQPTLAWAVSGGGTIDANGLFTAGIVAGGPFTVTASSGGVSGTATVSVNFTPIFTSVTFGRTSVSVAVNGTRQFTAAALDQNGNLMPNQPTFTFTVSGGGTVSASGLFTAGSVAGGPFTITATSGGISGSCAILVTFTPIFTSVSVAPASASVAVNGTQQFTATALDQNGNPMPSQPSFSWTVSGGGAIDANGLFTAGAVAGGPYTVTATSGAASGTAAISVTFTPVFTSIYVSPSGQTVSVNGTLQFTAYALDQNSHPMPSQPSFTWTVSGGGFIDANGLFTAGSTAGGPFTVTASSGGKSGTATVSVTFTPVITTITVSPPSESTPVNTTRQFTAVARDQNGDPLAGQPSFTWTVSGGGSIDANGLFTAGSTTGGPFTVTASSGGKSGTAITTVIFIPLLTTIVVSPTTATVGLGGSQQFAALAKDQNGNALTVQPTFTWSVSGGGTISQGGLFAAGSIAGGPFTVTASSGTVIGTATVTVVNGAPTVATAASASPNPVTGTTTTLTALGADDGGEANLTYTWATTGTPPATVTFSANGTNAAKSTVVTFHKHGTYTFRVTIMDTQGLSVTSSVNVTVDQEDSDIKVNPPAATVNTNSAIPFTATDVDQFGDPMTVQPPVTWSASGGGSIDGGGVYTANSAAGGPYTVTASTSGAVNAALRAHAAALAGTAVINVVFAPVLTSISVTPGSASVSTNGAQQFTATALDQAGNAMPNQPSFTWTASGGGSISTAGLYTAGSTAGGPFTVTASSGGLSGTAAVTVTFNPVITTITVSPTSEHTQVNHTQQFTATALDQNGNALSPQPSFAWTVSGGGTISGAGLFTAGNTAGGPFTVTASAGGKSGTAIENVVFTAILTSITVTPASAMVSVNGTQQFTATALDQNGNALSPQPAVTWTVTGGGTISSSGLFTAGSVPGTLLVVRATSGSVSGAAIVTVASTPVLTSIVVSPSSQSVKVTEHVDFTAVAKDQNGNILSPQPVITWSVSGGGTINSEGRFFAGSTAGGPFTVTATSGSVSGTASVTVNKEGDDGDGDSDDGHVSKLTITPSKLVMFTGSAQQFTAVAYNKKGHKVSPQPAILWTAWSGGSIDSHGIYTAGTTPGGPFTINAVAGGVSSTAQVTITNSYGVVALYDQTKARRSGKIRRIKVEIIDPLGHDVSSKYITVTTVSIIRLGDNVTVPVDDDDDDGDDVDNDDLDFRFNKNLGPSGGYVYKLKLTDYQAGVYQFNFKVAGDPVLHHVQFVVKAAKDN